MRLSPDSAGDRNTIANIIASQQIPRAAFDLFMVLLLLLRASVADFLFYIDIEPYLTLYDSA
jgi:hypothetical protein